jgi:hypothetical protein
LSGRSRTSSVNKSGTAARSATAETNQVLLVGDGPRGLRALLRQDPARSGYQGRRGVFEVLEVTSDLRRALLAGADEATVADLARRHGYVPMREAGLVLANHGKRTYEEVLRVTRATI